ncbi:hypothetical protein B0H12DRAFT_219479 [Mycena haematopus]|nr:hypothetical protein B0H12DRAFT_219479 [Mycena haematopus]
MHGVARSASSALTVILPRLLRGKHAPPLTIPAACTVSRTLGAFPSAPFFYHARGMGELRIKKEGEGGEWARSSLSSSHRKRAERVRTYIQIIVARFRVAGPRRPRTSWTRCSFPALLLFSLLFPLALRVDLIRVGAVKRCANAAGCGVDCCCRTTEVLGPVRRRAGRTEGALSVTRYTYRWRPSPSPPSLGHRGWTRISPQCTSPLLVLVLYAVFSRSMVRTPLTCRMDHIPQGAEPRSSAVRVLIASRPHIKTRRQASICSLVRPFLLLAQHLDSRSRDNISSAIQSARVGRFGDPLSTFYSSVAAGAHR